MLQQIGINESEEIIMTSEFIIENSTVVHKHKD